MNNIRYSHQGNIIQWWKRMDYSCRNVLHKHCVEQRKPHKILYIAIFHFITFKTVQVNQWCEKSGSVTLGGLKRKQGSFCSSTLSSLLGINYIGVLILWKFGKSYHCNLYILSKDDGNNGLLPYMTVKIKWNTV